MAIRIILWITIWILGVAQLLAQSIDEKATKKTKQLLSNLEMIAEEGFLFGHQDDRAYGVGWSAEEGRSDVLETVGKYPAVQGWDLGNKMTDEKNLDGVDFDRMKQWSEQIYKEGGLNTYSFHMANLTAGTNSWDTTSTVSEILPGGALHDAFTDELDAIADFFKSLKVGIHAVPVVFRPWHEHNGDWFWWGKGNCTEEEYIKLYRFTVDYLKNEKDVHNVLYAFSPDRSRWKLDSAAVENYFYGYPGDDYVDILGFDDYGDVGRKGDIQTTEQQAASFLRALELVSTIAKDHGKVAALTETGLEGVTNPKWFTEILLKPISENRAAIKIAWALMWRNYSTTHHYAPYPGHSSEADFRAFEAENITFFLNDIKRLYRKKIKINE